MSIIDSQIMTSINSPMNFLFFFYFNLSLQLGCIKSGGLFRLFDLTASWVQKLFFIHSLDEFSVKYVVIC